MSKLTEQPKRPVRPAPEPQALSEEQIEATLRERMKTFDQDAKAARPADEVMRRLLSRHHPKR